MRVIGLGDGFGAGVALVEDGTIRFAVSEERLSRIKNHSGYYHGFPYRSIEVALDTAGWRPESVDRIAVSNSAFPPLPLRLLALVRSRPVGEGDFLDRHEFSRTLNTRLYSVFSERISDSSFARAASSVRPNMQTKYPLHIGTLQNSLVAQTLSARAAFFRGLKDQFDDARQLTLMLLENLRDGCAGDLVA